MPPPMKPWIARHTIISLIEPESPYMKLAAVKPAADSANKARVPSARDRNPESGMATTSAVRYAVCTQEISSLYAVSAAWISVRVADTIWMSRIAMNIPNTMARKATSRRGSMRSSARLAAAPTEGDCVGGKSAVAVRALMERLRSARRGCTELRQRRQPVMRVAAGIDAHHDRHAGPQQAFAADAERHADPHGEALHDLGEVAGSVVGRQQRKHRARGRRHARNRSLDRAAGQRVDGDGDRLAGLQTRELGLLEVGVDIDRIERDHAGEPLARLHVVADLHGAIADHAVDRRPDGGEGEIALSLGLRRLELLERARGLLPLRLEHVHVGLGGVDDGLRILDRGDRLIPVCHRLFERLAARELLGGERLLAVELEPRARLTGLRRDELRLGLVDIRLLRDDLAGEALDRRLLGRDLLARRIGR